MSSHRPKKGKSIIEMIVGLTSAAIVCGLVSILGYEAFFGDAQPPDLAVALEAVEHHENGTIITVSVSNRGDKAASAVSVYGAASDSSGSAWQKEIEFDYVAAHSSRRGAFVLPGTIATDGLQLQIGGYAEP